eukprot:7630646-Alexandrium_andersonii.AAC.1
MNASVGAGGKEGPPFRRLCRMQWESFGRSPATLRDCARARMTEFDHPAFRCRHKEGPERTSASLFARAQ